MHFYNRNPYRKHLITCPSLSPPHYKDSYLLKTSWILYHFLKNLKYYSNYFYLSIFLLATKIYYQLCLIFPYCPSIIITLQSFAGPCTTDMWIMLICLTTLEVQWQALHFASIIQKSPRFCEGWRNRTNTYSTVTHYILFCYSFRLKIFYLLHVATTELTYHTILSLSPSWSYTLI